MINISEYNTNDPLLDMFLFETFQLTEQLEQIILNCESKECFSLEAINEIFRIMHTIKGSSAMMQFYPISTLAHSIEDLFYFLRAEKPKLINYSALSDIILKSIDFIKEETEKIKQGLPANGNPDMLIEILKGLLTNLKEKNSSHVSIIKETGENTIIEELPNAGENVSCTYEYRALIHFEEECEMENMRAFSVIRDLNDKAAEISYIPEDILEDDFSSNVIRQNGFIIKFKSNYEYKILYEFLMKTAFLKSLDLIQLNQMDDNLPICSKIDEITYQDTDSLQSTKETAQDTITVKENQPASIQQSIISVNVAKLDRLMDLVGEMVIAEAMVIQNPDLYGLELENFKKASRHLSKITGEMQDMVMSVRMVSLSPTFRKMLRIVRDMSKDLNKEVKLEIIGENTEVDKNIIEHISDPLMHLVRNALDHGIEKPDERLKKGKPRPGTITLEARNSGSDVLVIVKDDGKGLNKDVILKKAAEKALLPDKSEQLTDKEIFNLIFLPGFSTKDKISEYSGRGVGMDVVMKNIEAINGFLN
ncbi:chemotaxis protein CheA [Anaerocolumna sp. MB42-C2]|uniref:chemotaxis protein CheA n=1 Tax=Anaerocolumna sp. MB42-C2 TaxID=3070997 RepID=UPI0027DF0FD8|nr:chemotaxis protein CheA [Anaerocolumna sp. MB42-C2]WMJ85948.1 chemotaxis protein CheA [Anaerocolumna sp. MB42-C2]